MSDVAVDLSMKPNKRKHVRYLENVTVVYVFVMLVIFPFLMDTNLYYKITRAKFVWFTALTLLYIAATLFAMGLTYLNKRNAALRKSEGRIKLSFAQITVIIYMICGILSAINSEFGSAVILGQGRYEGLFSMLLYGTAFVFVAFWGEYDEIIPKGLAIFGISEGLFVVYQLSGLPIPAGLSHFATGFVGTFGNIDCMGGMVALTVPAMVAAYVVMDWKRRYLLLIAIYILMFAEGYVWVDSGLVGLAVAHLIALPFLIHDRISMHRTAAAFTALFAGMGTGAMFVRAGYSISFNFGIKSAVLLTAAVVAAILSAILLKCGEFRLKRERIRKYTWITLAICVILGLIGTYFYKGDILLIKEASEVLHGELSDSAGSGRGRVWKYCLELIPTVPILGTGPGTFYGAFAEYNKMLKDVGANIYFDFAHNDFLQIAICLGIVGLIIYLVFISTLAFNALRSAAKRPLALIFAAGCAGYLVHSFFSFSIAIMTPGFWVMAGMLDKISRADKKR